MSIFPSFTNKNTGIDGLKLLQEKNNSKLLRFSFRWAPMLSKETLLKCEQPCSPRWAPKQSNFIETTLWHGYSPVNLMHIFRTPFSKNTSGGLLLIIVFSSVEFLKCNFISHIITWRHIINTFCFRPCSNKYKRV